MYKERLHSSTILAKKLHNGAKIMKLLSRELSWAEKRLRARLEGSKRRTTYLGKRLRRDEGGSEGSARDWRL